MEQPLISVIVPVYKVEKWVEKCVRSLSNQTYESLEIICVDDGSPDNCGKLLDALAEQDSRIRVIHQQNQGLSAARNAALAVATGEWVTGVDGDDYLPPRTYADLVPYLTPEVDLLVYGTLEVDETQKPLREQNGGYFALPPQGVYPVTPSLMGAVNVCFCNKLWRRQVIREDKMQFPVGMLNEDEAFSRLFYPKCRAVAIVPSVVYCYVRRSGSITDSLQQGDRQKQAGNSLGIAEWLVQQYLQRGYTGDIWKYLLNLLYGASILTDAEACARLKKVAVAVAQHVSPETDYRVRYLLREKTQRHFWYRYELRGVTYGIGCLPLLRFYYGYHSGAFCGWETLPGMLVRVLKRKIASAVRS